MSKTVEATSKTMLAAGKNRAIVQAARDHFLREGFGGASMDAIARSADVSVKTIYSHFRDKGDLFRKVMVAACTDGLLSGDTPSEETLAGRFTWFGDTTRRGLEAAGKEYLNHLLSSEQLDLYRVVTRDADRFPELGSHYQKHIAQGRTRILSAYLHRLARAHGWAKRNAGDDATLYEALLRAEVYEEALHGLLRVTPDVINRQARSSVRMMWKWLTSMVDVGKL